MGIALVVVKIGGFPVLRLRHRSILVIVRLELRHLIYLDVYLPSQDYGKLWVPTKALNATT